MKLRKNRYKFLQIIIVAGLVLIPYLIGNLNFVQAQSDTSSGPPATPTPLPPGAKDYTCAYNNDTFRIERVIPGIAWVEDLFNNCNKNPNDSSSNNSSPSGTNPQLPPISTDILSLITSYNLPPPTLEGYTAQLQKLQSDPRATWAAKAVLSGEKLYKQKGGDIYMYLTTAWIWQESGGFWPDVYEINCNDNNDIDSNGKLIKHEFTDPDSLDQVSMFCKYPNFQLAGYRAAEHASEYQKLFKLLYGDTADVKPIMQKVIDNSTNALYVQESYLDQGQQKSLVALYLNNKTLPANISIDSISPSSGGFFNEKTQFYTLILGKDPNMVAALNAGAVKELPGLFKFISLGQNDKAGWAFYLTNTDLQRISNMIAALYLLDINATTIPASPPDVINNPLSGPIEQQVSQIVSEINASCTQFGSGIVQIRNIDCLNNVPSLTTQARKIMRNSVISNEFLQCVGFATGMIAQLTGQDITGHGDAIAYSYNPIPGYTFYRKGITPQVGDLMVSDYDTSGHIAFVVHVDDNTHIRIAQGNAPSNGQVDIKPYSVGELVEGFLRKQ